MTIYASLRDREGLLGFGKLVKRCQTKLQNMGNFNGRMGEEQGDGESCRGHEKGLSLLKFCRWRPNPAIVEAIAEHFEEEGDFENAKRYVKVLRKLNIMSLPLYKSFIRVCINTKRAPPNIPKMMARDQIDLDDETAELIIRANEIDIVDIS
uniref:Pentatricopeptide repeat-containing protein n=1 Tax=Ananas comosus var. bracteatus TaxID=296719 RepID=A0A6V7PAA3_ANACO|nr:unnamed protein product [Ananas comosus var. bracteatus]